MSPTEYTSHAESVRVGWSARESTQNPFIMVPIAAMEIGLSPQTFMVYAHAIRRCSGYNVMFESQQNIAESLGMSLSSVRRSLKELCNIGLLVRQENYREDGSRTTNSYSYRYPEYKNGGSFSQNGGGVTENGPPGHKERAINRSLLSKEINNARAREKNGSTNTECTECTKDAHNHQAPIPTKSAPLPQKPVVRDFSFVPSSSQADPTSSVARCEERWRRGKTKLDCPWEGDDRHEDFVRWLAKKWKGLDETVISRSLINARRDPDKNEKALFDWKTFVQEREGKTNHKCSICTGGVYRSPDKGSFTCRCKPALDWWAKHGEEPLFRQQRPLMSEEMYQELGGKL